MKVAISNIIIKDLFGQYSYNIKEQNKKELDISKLLILYGDNGCGKTTILRLIFDLFSLGMSNREAFQNISKTKFNSISIVFEDGYSLNVERNTDEYIGTFNLKIKKDNNIINEFKYTADNHRVLYEDEQQRKVLINHGIKSNEQEKSYMEIIYFLRERNPHIYYLTDKRNLLTTARTNIYFDEIDENIDSEFMKREYISNKVRVIKHNNSENDILISTLKQAERWVRDQSIQGSLRGDQDTNYIYKDIITRISNYDDEQTKDRVDFSGNEILNAIEDISLRSKSYSEFGLTSIIEYDDFAQIIKKCSVEKMAIIDQVLAPYVNGLLARMNALKELYDAINKFVNNINNYFNGRKFISFHIKTGFKIFDLNKEEIKPNYLSSGERQLLLLFCNALLAKDKATIFLIDEPEISLNIKWQRKLIDSLLDFSENGNIQYIIASHSMEILATHRNNVGKLEV